MDRKEKEKVVADLKERLGRAYAIFVVDYQGLKVGELTKLRRELAAADVDFRVVKNRLLLIACEDTPSGIIRDYIGGPCALAITGDDAVAPAKILTRFSQDYEALRIKIAQMGGKVIELPAIKRLAQLPSREVLLAQFVFSLSSIPTRFVATVSEMLRRLVTALEAIKRQNA